MKKKQKDNGRTAAIDCHADTLTHKACAQDFRPGITNASGEQRSGYELHPGRLSYGCITINKHQPANSQNTRAAEWKIIHKAITTTKTQEVPDNRGKHKYIPGATQTKYGVIQVIDKPSSGQAKDKPAPQPNTTTVTNP